MRRFALFVLVWSLCCEAAADTCNRDWFYKTWPVENRMDLRQILLEERAIGGTIVYETASGMKRVGRGTWVDGLTGTLYRAINPNEIVEDKKDASAKLGIEETHQLLTIDHIIPLQWACQHGADQWTDEKRREFATDELLLVITHSSVNASKGSQGPDTWQPPNADLACRYNQKFIYGIVKYGFDLSATEFATLLEYSASACAAAAKG